MNNLDIILIVALFIGFIIGYFKGLIRQLTFGAGIVIGLLQAICFYPVISEKIQASTEWNIILCNILAFIAIIVAIILIFKICGWLLSTLLKAIFLGFIDKILGGLFCCVITCLLVVGIVNVADRFMPEFELTSQTTQEQSLLYKHVQNETFAILGEMKELNK